MCKSFFLAFLSAAVAFAQAELRSPDGRVAMTFRTVARTAAPSQLVYTVSYQAKALIEPSALRLDLKDQAPLGPNVRIAGSTPSSADGTYHLIAGKASTVRNHYNALRLDIDETREARASSPSKPAPTMTQSRSATWCRSSRL